MFILLIITVYSLVASFHVCVGLRLPNHKRRVAIAKTVDDVGDQFRPAMGTRWLAYIKNLKAYGKWLLPLHPAKIWALWSWKTMSADVLLALLPRGIFFRNEY